MASGQKKKRLSEEGGPVWAVRKLDRCGRGLRRPRGHAGLLRTRAFTGVILLGRGFLPACRGPESPRFLRHGGQGILRLRSGRAPSVWFFGASRPRRPARWASLRPRSATILTQRPLIAKNAMNGAQLLRPCDTHDRATCRRAPSVWFFGASRPRRPARWASLRPRSATILTQRPLIAKNAMNGAQLLRPCNSHERATCDGHPQCGSLGRRDRGDPPAGHRCVPVRPRS